MTRQPPRLPRRNRSRLEAAVAQSRTTPARALAHFRLALFHDNNGREREAIPHYQRALRLGLPAALRADSLAWLASSLYKTGRPRAALRAIARSRKIAQRTETCRFLDRLERRVRGAILRARASRV